jgi:hypothetical protein
MLDDNHRYDGHFSCPKLFTGTYRNLGGQNATATGPSIDQVVSDAIAKHVNPPVPIMRRLRRARGNRGSGQDRAQSADPAARDGARRHGTKGTCAEPAAPTASGDYPTKVKLFNQMAALGIRCDATRVVSMVWGVDGDDLCRRLRVGSPKVLLDVRQPQGGLL